ADGGVEARRRRRGTGERGEVSEVAARERSLARRHGGIASLRLERGGEAALHPAIPKQRGDHVARALGRTEGAQGAGAARSEVDQRNVTGVEVDRVPRQGELRPALEQRLGDREATAPLHCRDPPAEDPPATAHLFSTAIFSASTASARRRPSSWGVFGSSTALTSGLLPLLASEIPFAVKYWPTVRSSAPPAARWITS